MRDTAVTIKAKPLLENRFWIVEDEGVGVGTLAKEGESFVFSKRGEINFFQNEQQLRKKFGNHFLTAQITTSSTAAIDFSVHGYPTKCKPHNCMYDIQRNLPLFTKTQESKSLYCAGYYLIRFNVHWLKSFCPKLTTVEHNSYYGPFKTIDEMKAKLQHVY
jgi:hypothetical protein